MALACLHSHSCTFIFAGSYQHNFTQMQDNFFLFISMDLRSFQLQISYKEVTKIYNEANYSNNKSK